MTTNAPSSTAASTLATILQSLRAARGWTQDEAAERCGVRKQTYNTWEAAKAETTLSSLTAVATAFGVTILVHPVAGLRVANS